jgi:rhodanese-related sulfurtransferase
MARSLDLNKHVLGIFMLCLVVLAALNAGHRDPDLGNVRDVSAPEAKALIDSGAAVIDVRGGDSYRARHIPGATPVALDELRSGIPVRIEGLRTRPVVVYCGDGVTSGPIGTAILNHAGFSKAVNLKPGLEGWQKAGFPTASG